jgi:hypothetical protein
MELNGTFDNNSIPESVLDWYFTNITKVVDPYS